MELYIIYKLHTSDVNISLQYVDCKHIDRFFFLIAP